MPKVGITELNSGLGGHHTGHQASATSASGFLDAFLREQHVTAVLVRHPFARFESWYRSKILLEDQLVRGNRTLIHDGTSDPSGRRPWNMHLLDSSSTTACPRHAYADAMLRMTASQRAALDPHLRSQTQLCRLHELPYDVVGSLENISAFEHDLRLRMGATSWEIKWSHIHSNGGAAHWRSTLDCSLKQKLRRIYSDDFRMLERLRPELMRDGNESNEC